MGISINISEEQWSNIEEEVLRFACSDTEYVLEKIKEWKIFSNPTLNPEFWAFRHEAILKALARGWKRPHWLRPAEEPTKPESPKGFIEFQPHPGQKFSVLASEIIAFWELNGKCVFRLKGGGGIWEYPGSYQELKKLIAQARQ